MNVDLWLKMVKKGEFQPIDRLLSSAVMHEDAKGTALRNSVFFDCALVVPGLVMSTMPGRPLKSLIPKKYILGT